MSDLSSEKKTVYALLADNKADFLIPNYQRNYSWGQEHCEKLWTDLVTFAIPNNDAASFDNNEEYFLGTILTFKNDYKQKEVIDGQQRLITFMLLLRAFYESLDKNANASNLFNSSNKNPNVNKFCDKIAECIWKLDDNYLPDKTKMKIKSEVSSDEAAEELQKIIETGTTQNGSKNKYAENYRYFQITVTFKNKLKNLS